MHNHFCVFELQSVGADEQFRPCRAKHIQRKLSVWRAHDAYVAIVGRYRVDIDKQRGIAAIGHSQVIGDSQSAINLCAGHCGVAVDSERIRGVRRRPNADAGKLRNTCRPHVLVEVVTVCLVSVQVRHNCCAAHGQR